MQVVNRSVIIPEENQEDDGPSPFVTVAGIVSSSLSSPEEVDDSTLTPVHSNYVPAQMEKHLEFLDFNSMGDLIVGASSLTTRYWTGSLWYYKKGVDPSNATNPEKCLTGVDLETGVVGGRFVQDKQMVLGLDSGVVMVSFTKEQDGDRIIHYLEQQTPVVMHDDILTGLDVCEMDDSVATVGGDHRLTVLSPDLKLVHNFHPAHKGLISSVAFSSVPFILATSSCKEGVVRVWDCRQARPAKCVYKSEDMPPSCLTWSGDQEIVVGSSTGDLMVVDIRSKNKNTVNISKQKIFDREVSRMRWSPDRKGLAVAGDDVTVGVVEVKEGQVVEVMVDTSHTDYVRGLAWSDTSTLWSAGWDHKVVSHNIQ